MLRHVLFDLSLFNDEQDRANSQKRVLALLQALTYCNQLYLRNNPETPLIYKSGIKYKVPQQFEKDDTSEVGVLRQYLERQGAPREVWQALHSVNGMVGGEKFRDISRIIENGGGDCFPLTQKVIVRSRATGTYEILSLGELRHAYSGYEALSYNFTSCKYEFKPILGFVDKGVKSVSVARLSNGTDLVATDDHKFWTLTGSKQNMQLEVKRMGEYVEAQADHAKGLSVAEEHSRILVASHVPQLAEAPVFAAHHKSTVTHADGSTSEYNASSLVAVQPNLVQPGFSVSDELPGLTYATVRHAMPAGTAHVGCIEVEGNHNFVLADGTIASNCDNVASWRAAELRELGIRAQPYITWRRRPDGGMTYHVIVRWPDGTAEDPSLLLGMGGAAKEQDRREEERKLAERMVDFIEGIKAKKYVETVFGEADNVPGEHDFDDDAFSVELDGCE